MRYPLVSIVVPTYNRKEKLKLTIETLEKSDYPKDNIEILIVDDCSNDNTKKVVNKLIRRYKNIKYFKTKKNSGPAAARNIGIKNSRGGIIFFTDDDGIIPRNWIKDFVEFYQKHRGIYGIGGILKAPIDNIFAKLERVKNQILGIQIKGIMIGRSNVPIGFTSNLSYRKEVFDKIGHFDENFKVPAGEDLEFKKRVAKKFKLAFLPVPIIHNHEYNLDYFLGIMFKQGLNKMPPKKFYEKLIVLTACFPVLLFNVLKKTISYRKKD